MKEKSGINFNIKHHINWMAVAVALIAMIFMSGAGMLPRAIISLLTRIAYSMLRTS